MYACLILSHHAVKSTCVEIIIIIIIRSACSNSTVHPERKQYGYGTGKVQVLITVQ